MGSDLDLRTLAPEAHGLQREPARLLQFKGTVWTMLEPSRANETGVECIYFYTATNDQITFYQLNYYSTNAVS